MMKTILITGGCGFVGSNLAVMLKLKYPGYRITALDNLRRRGSELNIARLSAAGVAFLHGDVRNREDLAAAGPFDLLIEASAEPSVLAGIDGPLDYLVNTNLIGTINCLNQAARHGAAFIFLSTSRVYPIRKLESIRIGESPTRFTIAEMQDIPGISPSGITEDFPLEGARSFYGASKLASELLINEYHEMRGLPSVINRCGVIAGPHQMGRTDQGFVVLWVARHIWNGKLEYIGYGGNGRQVRDILHVRDLCRLIDHQIHHLEDFNGQTFNVGGGPACSISLAELTALCSEVTGNDIQIGPAGFSRPADVPVYITDNTRISILSGWKPECSPLEIVTDIYQWIIDNRLQLERILN